MSKKSVLTNIAFSSKTDEWYTPQIYTDAAREVMGSIDLDPASNETANRWIQAKRFFTREENGLIKHWHDCSASPSCAVNVWLNPPYGKTRNRSNQGIWSARLIHDYEEGTVKQAVLLVNLMPGYPWFSQLLESGAEMCMVDHRISFINPAQLKTGKAKQNSVFFYFGPRRDKFREVFSRFGVVGRLERIAA